MSNVHIFVPFKGEQKFSKLFAILTRRNFSGKYLNHADCRIAIKTHKHKARVEKQIQKCVVYGLTWEGFTDIILRVSVFRLLSGDQSLAFGTRFFILCSHIFNTFCITCGLGAFFCTGSFAAPVNTPLTRRRLRSYHTSEEEKHISWDQRGLQRKANMD